MYYSREVAHQIEKLRKGFPVISVIGPRQSGKTTFLQHYFKHYSYFNLENPQTRDLIEQDPQQFITLNPKNIIIDEVQRLPDLLSYIQVHVDKQQEMGSIVISGSQNLLISEKISQSLAGRAAYQNIFPFSLSELQMHGLALPGHLDQMLKGFYPAVYTREIEPNEFYNQYIVTYVDRDARLIKNIQNLSQFQKFMRLLAGRVGQIVNISSLANDTGVAPNTAEDWISILEASYIVYRLHPYYKNIGKRLIKSPKVYFYDTGLLCALLNVVEPQELATHFLIGGIFENFIISEFKKELSARGLPVPLYFYRDQQGREIDLIFESKTKLIPVEIKSSSTFNRTFFDAFTYWRKNIQAEISGYVIYSGLDSQKVGEDNLLAWNKLDTLIDHL
ncbi:AAA family ATPase [Candidatus Peregrinibacteria bacterium CG11_big_fil_rev_8_21_14_0_20_46_8]|nr:MAG: AAA family ATPase [Candidatus Peregrinibacteria bacterium CG11_big_fil_rev_8_21_14_0_20_46_8]